MTLGATFNGSAPSIGNGRNEIGWVEGSDSPYFIPGVPCTTAYIYDTLTGVMAEADTTCNAMAYQWPDNLFGLYTQDDVVDAESAALTAFGSWLGLDASLEYDDPMYPMTGSGRVLRYLDADEFAFGRHQYGDGTSPHGSIGGIVRFSDGSPIPCAYVTAIGTDGSLIYGAVADGSGAYTIFEPASGSYLLVVRPLTTDPYVESSVPYRANPTANLDFSPEYYGGGALVQVSDGSTTPGIDITVHRSGSQPDSSEPNDSAASASFLTVGYSRLSTTHAPNDFDWYWFQTAANTCYLVTTGFHGASIVPTLTPESFWSRTRLSLFDGPTLVAQNDSRDEFQQDPGNWLTFCETGSGRRLDIEVAQRSGVGGAGFFYSLGVRSIADGPTLTPRIDQLYPNSGWSDRETFVWVDGADVLPGAIVEIRVPNAGWVAASEVIPSRCDAAYHCGAVKARFPASTPGAADVRITNPNGRSATKSGAFTYLATRQGPFGDRTPQAFGQRFGQGKAVCIGDYDGDGSDDIFKSRYAGLSYQLFRNNGDGTFADVAGTSGLRLAPALYGESCSFIDIDDDGDLDLYTTNLGAYVSEGSTGELYINQLAETGRATFLLNTPSDLGGGSDRFQTDAAWADFDNDGRLDAVLVDDAFATSPPYRDAVRLLRQTGNGSFSNVTSSSGLAGYVAAITSVKAADFDNDGCEDLVFFTYAGAANRLYTGNCHGQFTDTTAQAHIADAAPWCTGVAVADFNNDGNLDIFCGTYNAGAGPVRPRLWLNNGSAVFTDRAVEAGLYAVARNMDVVLALDEDNDGLEDVYIGASENGWLDDRKDVLLRNTGGNPPHFTDVTSAANMYPTTQDGTGYCSAGVDEYYCDRDAAAGGVLDWYNDGALDVFVTGSDPDALQRGSDFLWRNGRNVLTNGSIAPANDWVEIELKGANTTASRVLSNRLGIGARVTVVPSFHLPGAQLPSETQCLQNPLPPGVAGKTQEVIAGNQSQSSTILHFGLGTSIPFGLKRVDCVRVEWPSGLERAYTGVIANSKVVLAEDVGRMKVVAVIPNAGANSRSDPTTISGLRFDRDVSAVPAVFFGSVPAASVTFVSEHELTVLPPLWQPPGVVDVTVVNTDGESDTLLAAYTYTGSTTTMRFKDPVPSIITTSGAIPNDPEFIATRGVERTGVIADGITELVFEADIPGPGRVRFALDDDDDSGNSPPSGASVGSLTALAGGSPQTSLTVPAIPLADGRFIGHAVFTAPHEFIRTVADDALGTRSIRVRATFIDSSNVEHAMPQRSLDLYRVPVLAVHGMWGDASTFGWPVLDDGRFIVQRADYSATSDVTFGENAAMPPRVVAELRKRINDMGIAGTRFFVFGHSMGALLFKIYMGGAGAPYARADNFFAGDVYALVSIDAPFLGSYLASFMRFLASLPTIGPQFTASMNVLNLRVDRGCMESLDPAGPDIAGIPVALGAFHSFVGWGGREMRTAGIQFADDRQLVGVANVIEFLGYSFDNFLLRCGPGDDFVVCTDSQEGGLSSAYVDSFHYVDLQAKAIHFDSISEERAPSTAAERLLNTTTANSSVWSYVLPAVAPMQVAPGGETRDVVRDEPVQAFPVGDGMWLSLAKQSDGIALNWTGAASRLWTSLTPTLAGGVCLAVSGGGATDPHALAVPTNTYYEVGSGSLCTAGDTLSIGSISPASGATSGGYRITILGTAFGPGTQVRIGDLYADSVVAVNSTTLTFRMTPGTPGETTITVIEEAGHTANTLFTYTDPGPSPGIVQITAPADGAVVTAGSTITVSASGSGGFVIAGALVTSSVFSTTADRDPGDPFVTTATIPADAIGPIAIGLLARDANGNVKSATPVTITAVVPGNVALQRLDAEKLTLLYASPIRQLRVYGIYADGIRREITHAPGMAYEMDTQDPRKPNYPYNGTGVAVVDASGLVAAKTHGTTLCHVSYSGLRLDVVVEVAETRPMLTILKPGFISWPYQGAEVTYDVVRGKLSGLRATGGNYADPSLGTICIKDNFANVTAADSTNPPGGDGYFYLMRDSRTLSYEEQPFWATRSQLGQRTGELNAAPVRCP